MSGNLYATGVRPAIDEYLLKKSQERRDYGDYWSASSAGYCMRKVYFDRLQVPHVKADARKQRVFTVGNVFHAWIQGITHDAGLSIEQETELVDDTLMVMGHIDDLVNIDGKLILIDYKSQNSRSFTYTAYRDQPMSHYHRMQLATYLYMLRATKYPELTEGRILKISKDDLRMSEEQLLWSPALEKEVVGYWNTLNGYWKNTQVPACTCADYENGFMAKITYNPYFYGGEPCSLKWFDLQKGKL